MTNVGSEEIDGLALKTYRMVVAGVLLQNERKKNQRDEGLAKAPVCQRHSAFTKVSLETS